MRKPKPRVRVYQVGRVRSMLVEAGTEASRRHVALIAEPSGDRAGTLFVHLEVETADRKQRQLWNARVHCEQIDNLIACLATAKARMQEIGA